MLKLKNIKLTTAYIKADYSPEDSEELGHIEIDIESQKVLSKPIVGYEKIYPTMAERALRKILEGAKTKSGYQTPKEKLVMWY